LREYGKIREKSIEQSILKGILKSPATYHVAINGTLQSKAGDTLNNIFNL